MLRSLLLLFIYFSFLVLWLWQGLLYSSRGYPYETWDEIATSNSAMVLDMPEVLRTYRYGSLDTFLHKIAHVLYQTYDNEGKRHLRHSYSNNVFGSLTNPFFLFDNKDPNLLDYNYFRGVNDHQPIFIARKIYVGVQFLLLAAAGCSLIYLYGIRATPLLAGIVTLITGPYFLDQATLALPNGINGCLSILIVYALGVAILDRKKIGLIIASIMLACGINMKLDFILWGAPIGCAALLYIFLYEPRVKSATKILAINACSFLIALFITKPALFTRPLAEYEIQRRVLSGVVQKQTQIFQNVRELGNYLANEVTTLIPLPFDYHGILACVLGSLFVLTYLALTLFFWKRWNVLSFLLLTFCAVALLWYVPIINSVVIYRRYFINGAAALIGGICMTTMWLHYGQLTKKQTIFSSALFVVLLIYIVANTKKFVEDALFVKTTLAENRGLDPALSRNVGSIELLKELEKLPPQTAILVDQHSYTDLRIFWQTNHDVQWINAMNFGRMFRKYREQGALVLYTPGAGGLDELKTQFPLYQSALEALPKVWKVDGRVMNTLSPAPVLPDDAVTVARLTK